MQQALDPKNLFSALHYQVTGELLQLMDGFYSNIEDGLFELAYANDNPIQQRHVVELMRELRFRRKHLIKTFGKRMQASAKGWMLAVQQQEYIEERMLANGMAQKCASHFSGLLQSIAERTAHASQREVKRSTLPISPEEISYQFVMSCRSVKFDKYSIETVQSLFSRFVLDRLGHIYGSVNTHLQEAGYLTASQMEMQALSTA